MSQRIAIVHVALISPLTSSLYKGVDVPIPTFPPVLNIFVFVVFHANPFQNGVAHSIPACKNPVAHPAPVDPVAHLAQLGHVAHGNPCIPCIP